MNASNLLAAMKRKYPDFMEAERGEPLDPSKVPENLRAYIPLAELWGVMDDIEREKLVERAPGAAKQELIRFVGEIDDDLDEWLAGPEADAEMPSREYIVFSAMRMAADFIQSA